MKKFLLILTAIFSVAASAQDVQRVNITCQVKTQFKGKALFKVSFPKEFLDTNQEQVYVNYANSLLTLDGVRAVEESEDILKSTMGVYSVGKGSKDNAEIENPSYVIYTDYTKSATDKIRIYFNEASSFFGIKAGQYKNCTRQDDTY